ncbi:MAG: hypothetical protein IJP96_01360, partial [Synergistaceae bacterium]|nr:hypothetical protein [Synergistaceae bacterium]
MLNAIRQAKEIESIIQVGFTGGEIFLFPELLKTGVNFAKKIRFQSYSRKQWILGRKICRRT